MSAISRVPIMVWTVLNEYNSCNEIAWFITIINSHLMVRRSFPFRSTSSNRHRKINRLSMVEIKANSQIKTTKKAQTVTDVANNKKLGRKRLAKLLETRWSQEKTKVCMPRRRKRLRDRRLRVSSHRWQTQSGTSRCSTAFSTRSQSTLSILTVRRTVRWARIACRTRNRSPLWRLANRRSRSSRSKSLSFCAKLRLLRTIVGKNPQVIPRLWRKRRQTTSSNNKMSQRRDPIDR